jgi:hypothetical protein
VNKWKNSCAAEMLVLFEDSTEGSCNNTLFSYDSLMLLLLLPDAAETANVVGLFVVFSEVCDSLWERNDVGMPLTCCDDVTFWLLTGTKLGGRSEDEGGDWVSDMAPVSAHSISVAGDTDDGILDVNECKCVMPGGFCVAADVSVNVT